MVKCRADVLAFLPNIKLKRVQIPSEGGGWDIQQPSPPNLLGIIGWLIPRFQLACSAGGWLPPNKSEYPLPHPAGLVQLRMYLLSRGRKVGRRVMAAHIL